MKDSFKKITSSMSANMVAQLVTICIQLVSVPVFLSIWDLEEYGKWLMISAIPAYIALADFGFLAVTINKMTMLTGSGEADKAQTLFQTAISMCVCVFVLGILLSFMILEFIHLDFLGKNDKFALLLLITASLIALSCSLIDAVFRSQGEFANGVYILNGIRITEWGSGLLGAYIFASYEAAAMGILLGRIVSAFIGIFITKNKFKNIKWGVKKGSLAEFRILLKPALAFMAFPIGNAIFFQGLTILIGLYFSPAFLALYNTYRTLSRTVVQSVNVIAKSFGPEMSRKYGQSGFEPVWRLYRKGLLLTMIVSICIGVLLYFGGEIILLWWVGGKIKFNSLIFNGFLLASLINALWQVDMVCLTSLNKHGPMGATYLTASIAMVFTMVLINNSFGEIGSLLPIYLFEFIVGVFCYFSVRKLKNDNLKVLN